MLLQSAVLTLVLVQTALSPEYQFLLEWNPRTCPPISTAEMKQACEQALADSSNLDELIRKEIMIRHALLASFLEDEHRDDLVKSALQHSPGNLDLQRARIASLLRAWQRSGDGVHLRELTEFLETIQADYPGSWTYPYGLGLVAGLQGKNSIAEMQFNRAIALDQVNQWSLSSRARLYCVAGRFEEADRDIETLLRMPPMAPELQAGIDSLQGSLFMQRGHYVEAISALHSAKPYFSSFELLLDDLQFCYEHERLFGMEYHALQDRLRVFPESATAHARMAAVACQLGLVDEQRAAVEKTLALKPTDAASWQWLGNVYFADGDFRAAAAAFEQAAALSPPPRGNPDNFLRRALLQATCPEESLRNGSAAADTCRMIGSAPLNEWEDSRRLIYACALAEVKLFDRAVKELEAALARPDLSAETAAAAQKLRELFSQQTPYRMPVDRSARIFDVPVARRLVVIQRQPPAMP